MIESNLSFDFKTGQSKTDAMDRVHMQIEHLQKQNHELINEMQQLRRNPKSIISNFEKKLKEKIYLLQEQNRNIQARIQSFSLPGFAQMTKKKTHLDPRTPKKTDLKVSQSSQWQQNSKRNAYQSLDMSSDKCQVSTCQNFISQSHIQQNPLRSLQPLQRQQLRDRTSMTIQLMNLLKISEKLDKQVEQSQKQSELQQKKDYIKKQAQSRQLQKISQYKKKLLNLLKKLKSKETNTERLVGYYQQIYEQTMNKLKQSTELLQNVQSADINNNVDDLYAEVLSLQQKLKYINQQLQQLDQRKWLNQIIEELQKALRRLGLQIPKQKQQVKYENQLQMLRDRVDQLCQMILEIALLNQGQQKQKLVLVKHYYEQQKENNKKIIKKMQQKQQILSKKLIDMQMNN